MLREQASFLGLSALQPRRARRHIWLSRFFNAREAQMLINTRTDTADICPWCLARPPPPPLMNTVLLFRFILPRSRQADFTICLEG